MSPASAGTVLCGEFFPTQKMGIRPLQTVAFIPLRRLSDQKFSEAFYPAASEASDPAGEADPVQLYFLNRGGASV